MARILIADDEVSLRKVLAASLRREGYEVVAAQDGAEALQLLEASLDAESGEPFELLISDLQMPNMDGMALLQKVRERFQDTPVVMLTAHGTVDLAVQALKRGAFDFVTKPYERDELLAIVRKGLGQAEKEREEAHAPAKSSGRLLIGASERMRDIGAVIKRVADTPSTVLITGESGTGKELVAVALHEGSARKDKPFIRINCGAIPATLIEAELFGHEKGAFTGAVTEKPGRFELAHTGTLFLDEIGDLPLEMQVKLLRVLQEGTLERIGGIETIEIDVRLIAATNKNLEKATRDGEFREDLFYRLNVVPVELPPLRLRTADIPPLVEHFLKKFNARLGRDVERLTPAALDTLAAYPWPGNIRELENIIERTVLFADQPVIGAEDLPPEIRAKAGGASEAVREAIKNAGGDIAAGEIAMKEVVKKATAQIERDLIAKALEETEGNVTHAARRLKISRKSLQIKMRDLGLREEQPAAPAGSPDSASGST